MQLGSAALTRTRVIVDLTSTLPASMAVFITSCVLYRDKAPTWSLLVSPRGSDVSTGFHGLIRRLSVSDIETRAEWDFSAFGRSFAYVSSTHAPLYIASKTLLDFNDFSITSLILTRPFSDFVIFRRSQGERMGPISFLFQPDFNSAWPLFSDQHEYAGAATGKRDQHGFFPKGDLPSDQEAISVSPYDRMGPLSFHLRPQESAHRIRLDARILLDTGFHHAPT